MFDGDLIDPVNNFALLMLPLSETDLEREWNIQYKRRMAALSWLSIMWEMRR